VQHVEGLADQRGGVVADGILEVGVRLEEAPVDIVPRDALRPVERAEGVFEDGVFSFEKRVQSGSSSNRSGKNPGGMLSVERRGAQFKPLDWAAAGRRFACAAGAAIALTEN